VLVSHSESQNPADIVGVVQLLMQSAKESVKLSTALTTDLVQGARPDMEAAIQRVKTFQVWLDGGVDYDRKKAEFPWLLDNPKVSVYQSKVSIPHWIIVDDRDFRMEKPHDPSGSYPRKNMMVLDCKPSIATELLSQFRQFCSNSVTVRLAKAD
jgi:hypothetical protein